MSGAPVLTPADPDRDYFDKPWFAVDPANGNLYLAVNWVKFGSSGERTVIFFRSLNGGSTWAHQEFREAGKPLERPYLTVGSGTIYLFWCTSGVSDPIRIRKSTNQGTSFTLSGQNGLIPNNPPNDTQIVDRANLLRNSHDDGVPALANDPIGAPSIFQVAVNTAFNPHHVNRRAPSIPSTEVSWCSSTLTAPIRSTVKTAIGFTK